MSEREDLLGSAPQQQLSGHDAVASGAIKKVNVLQDEFGMDIPVESVPLPSKGLIYPPDHPLCGQETVDIKPMTAKEEDILTSRALIKKGTVITELIRSCLVDKRIDPDDMISGDRNAIMIALRITGYGSDYNVEIECPHCGEKDKYDFDLASLEIKRLQVDPVDAGSNLFELQLPVCKKSIKVKFLTGKDEHDMLVTSERKKKKGLKKNDTLITDRLSRSIVEVGGITDKNKIAIFASNLPVRDSLALRKFLDTYEPGIDMSGWVTCTSCSESSEVKMPLGASFFWPDL